MAAAFSILPESRFGYAKMLKMEGDAFNISAIYQKIKPLKELSR